MISTQLVTQIPPEFICKIVCLSLYIAALGATKHSKTSGFLEPFSAPVKLTPRISVETE